VPLEQYAHGFDDLFPTHLPRRRFREYLAGLLLPRARHKTLTALVGAEPITQAQMAPSSNCSSSSGKATGTPKRSAAVALRSYRPLR
jgi:hypothetical protein